MRVARYAITEVDRYVEEAQRAKNQLDFERWRAELRPRALHVFAARAAKLSWSRALLRVVVEELYPDDLFSELIGNLDRVPARQWPRVLAIAVALRRSWRRDGLAKLARGLHVSLSATDFNSRPASQRSRPSPNPLSGSPRFRQGSPLRSDPAKRGSRP